MIRLYLDVNVLMDFYLKRVDSAYTAASKILTLAIERKVVVVVDTRTITFTYFHLFKKLADSKLAKQKLADLLPYIELVSLSPRSLTRALDRDHPTDLEDAAQLEIALQVGADVILTSDKGFVSSEILVLSPDVYIHNYESAL